MHQLLIGAGIGWDELEGFEGGEAKPDLLGINHYLTSERFLDHRVDLYPGHEIGGNGRDTYVDAEAVRVKRLDEDTGFAPRPSRGVEAATGIPHGGDHRRSIKAATATQQQRWFAEVWDTAKRPTRRGQAIFAP
jgi:dTDP-4-dehydrorhamnose reductase